MPTLNDIKADKSLRVEINKAYLVAMAVEFSMLEPTATGLKKSILDATRSIRSHFESESFHFFNEQGQGSNHKEIRIAHFVSSCEIIQTKVSLYRPKTKSGDPRMWFSGLNQFAQPSDQIAIVVYGGELYLFNLTNIELDKLTALSPARSFFSEYFSSKNSIADELLEKLRKIAKSPIKVAIVGDTAVGMAVESALNIPANSSKNPDYKGIELKSGRGQKNRSNLFAQVADWTISTCKSSAEILDKYGYARGADFKLYCTISTQKRNSQGLQFKYDEPSDRLIEIDNIGKEVAVWPGDVLRKRLIEKHAETFWIQAKSINVAGVEYFDLISVTHTKSPLVSQLLPMIQSGKITMDHLIKRKGGLKSKVSEKGPLFKIHKRDLQLLFPAPKTYSLKS